MVHKMQRLSYKISTSLLAIASFAILSSSPVHAQYLVTDLLQEELSCRSAIKSCLKPVSCSEVGKAKSPGKENYCWQNQCHFKSHITVGSRGEFTLVKVGEILQASVQDPFQMDFDAPILGSHVQDCKDPASARAISKSQRPLVAKTAPSSSPVLPAQR